MIVSKEDAFSLKQEQPTHFNYIDKTDSRFGMLYVHHYAGRNSHGKHQFACECDCGNFCLVTSVNLNDSTVGCGCLQQEKWRAASAETRRIKIDETERWISENTDYIAICNNEASTRAKWTFLCKEHGVFKAQLNLVKQDKVGCPHCRPGGGYRGDRKGSLYIHRVYKDGIPICLKFGITNLEVSKRKYQIEFGSKHKVSLETIYSFTHENGKIAAQLEREIFGNFTTKVISKEILKDGYTETVSLSDEGNLMKWLNKTINNLEI